MDLSKTDHSMLNSENAAWLADFKQKYDRTPRILHIGNIANNAYNNAKLLNEAGLDCDVICYDYYHIMGCPEWEDADFEGEIADQLRPDWAKVNLNSFKRPRWFVQGPLMDCLEYLENRNNKPSNQLQFFWNKLCVLNNTYARRNKKIADEVFTYFIKQSNRVKRYYKVIQIRINLLEPINLRLMKYNNSFFPLGDMLSVTLFFLLIPVFLIIKLLYCKPDNYYSIDRRVEEICDEFHAYFSDRDDRLTKEDFAVYMNDIDSWHKVMQKYDLIIGYSTDSIYPLLANKTPFCALEHGTLRTIPYEPTSQGRLCAISYKKADHVFVTNFDCVSSAKDLAPDRFTIINHPYDEDQPMDVALDWQSQRAELMETLQADMLLFHPTRHDWVKGAGYADKGNELLLHSFGKLRSLHGLKLGIILCEWGANVDESKALLNKYGVSNHVAWVKPLGMIGYARMCKATHMVIDQFKLGAFGGVTFKALAAGAPVMIYLDVERLSQQYPEAPPAINCSTEIEITDQILYWYYKLDELLELGKKGRLWMKKYHNKVDTVNRQVDVYRDLIQKNN